MNRNSMLAGAVLALLMLPAIAHGGATYFVNGTCGNDAWNGTSSVCAGPNGPKLTIQAAIDAATDGEEVEVAAGTYIEAIDFTGKEVLVRSASGAAVTILDGSGLDVSIVTCTSMETNASVLEGFTLRHGEGTEIEVAPTVFERFGGAMFCNEESSPTVNDCIFEQNQVFGISGGAVANRNGSSPVFNDCTFDDNQGGLGGAVANINSASGVFRLCIFTNNHAQTGGAMANHSSSSPEVTGCLFHDNTATICGAAMYTSFASSPAVTNCTVTGNDASAGDGGGFFINASNPVLTGTIVWGNSDVDGTDASAQIHVTSGLPTVNYSCVQGGWVGAGTNNVFTDPKFNNAAADDFTLDDFSPAIDAGDNGAFPAGLPLDLGANTRFIEDEGVTDLGNGAAPVIDMGVYERQVNSETTLAQVPSQFGTIQEGINAAAPGGADVVIAPGTYVENINTIGKAVHLQPAPGPGAVIVDGGGMGDVITINAGEAPTTVIEGLTIRNGGAPTGSGIRIDGASPMITDCILENNDAGLGGGIYVTNLSSPSISGCTFESNSAGLGGALFSDGQSLPSVSDCEFIDNISGIGGAVYLAEQSDGSFTDCHFSGNTAVGSGLGGAIFCSASSADMTRCWFLGNNAINGGALLLASGSSPNVFNCFFAGNDANNNGGAIAIDTGSFPVIANCAFVGNEGRFGGALSTGNEFDPMSVTVSGCTFANNTAETEGGAIYMGGGDVLAANCILWNNTPQEIFEIFSPPGVTAVFSVVQGGWPGTGNLNVNPMFVDADGPDNMPGTADDDVRLQAGSVAIDAGSNFFIPPGAGAADLDGNPRVVNAVVDMGCYEAGAGGTPCPADLNGDGDVGFADILQVIGNWGPCGACPEDLNGNGSVDFADILFIIGQFGACPP
jgi:predicted outer membrane repeat protein